MILVGAGLQNILVALCLLKARPNVRLLLLEQSDTLQRNRTWCFFETDVSAPVRASLTPIISRTWAGYHVAFPGHGRQLSTRYSALEGHRVGQYLAEVLEASPNAAVKTGVRVARVGAGVVTCTAGESYRAEVIIDARGPSQVNTARSCAYQKFVGLELELLEDAPSDLPCVMDATVSQLDGFRFFYTLPLSRRRILVEDTYFSRSPALDPDLLERRVLDYAARRGLKVRGVKRREQGVLPLPLSSVEPLALRRQGKAVVVPGGYAGGWFHPTTGYSFPGAARLAEMVAATADVDALCIAVLEARKQLTRQQRFGIWLNRLLFFGFAKEDGWRALCRFYRLPEPSIARFYALKSTRADHLRVLCGKPPQGISALRLAGLRGVGT